MKISKKVKSGCSLLLWGLLFLVGGVLIGLLMGRTIENEEGFFGGFALYIMIIGLGIGVLWDDEQVRITLIAMHATAVGASLGMNLVVREFGWILYVGVMILSLIAVLVGKVLKKYVSKKSHMD